MSNWRETHKEHLAELQRNWHKTHPNKKYNVNPERKKGLVKKWRMENREHINLARKLQYQNNKEKCSETRAKWLEKNYIYMRKKRAEYREKNREHLALSARQRNRKLKQLLMDKYGGKCVGCGETELTVLTMDHINDDGYIERQLRKEHKKVSSWYVDLLKSERRIDLQILCANCQMRKKIYGSNFVSKDQHKLWVETHLRRSI